MKIKEKTNQAPRTPAVEPGAAVPQRGDEKGKGDNFVLRSVNLQGVQKLGLAGAWELEASVACDKICDSIVCDTVVCDKNVCDSICSSVCDKICDQICDAIVE